MPERKDFWRNLRLVEAKLSRTSQTPRAVLIDQYPDDEQCLKFIPTTCRAKPFVTGVFTGSMAPCGPLYSSPANTPVTKGFDCQRLAQHKAAHRPEYTSRAMLNFLASDQTISSV